MNVDYDDCVVPMDSSGIKYEDGDNEFWYKTVVNVVINVNDFLNLIMKLTGG